MVLLLSFGAQASAAVTITFIHTDLYNSPVAATDINGNVIWQEDYQPYGQKLKKEPGSAGQKNWYTGKPQDPDTGLVYMGARYYNPQLGRFMSTDPVGFQEDNIHSFNRYAYANNNPYKYVDPDGENPKLILDFALNVAINYATTGEYDLLGAATATAIGALNPVKTFQNAAKLAKIVSGKVAKGVESKRILSADVLRKTDKFHNFPSQLDDEILKTKPTVVKDFFNKSKPGLSNDTKRFTMRGSAEVDGTARQGTFEIFTRPSTSGRNEVITHRFFNPD